MRSPENAGEGELIEHGDEKKKRKRKRKRKNANNK
jgi:hypothetical protein